VLPPKARIAVRAPLLLKHLIVAGTLCLAGAHYWWTASSSGNPVVFARHADDYYNLLTDALLAGRLSLATVPDPALLRLKDPYDPVANRPFRIPHVSEDLSLYKGKLYLYFGVVPAFALFMPFRILSGACLPENLAVALFMFGGAVFAVLSLELISKRWFPKTPFFIKWLCHILLAFSTFAPFVLRRPAVYEVAVSAGYFFIAGGVFWLLLGVPAFPPRRGSLLLGSLFLGLAVGCRPTLILTLFFLLAALAQIAPGGFRGGRGQTWSTLACLMVPAILVLIALALYNHARFDSWFDFGIRYSLSAWRRAALFSGRHLTTALWLLFLRPPLIDLDFPFFHLDPVMPIGGQDDWLTIDSIGGLMSCVPGSSLALASALFLRQGVRRMVSPFPSAFALTLLAVASSIALLIGCFHTITQRYTLDFAPLVLLSASIVWMQVDALLTGRRRIRWILNPFAALLIGYSTVLNLAVGLTGYSDWLRLRNRATYESLEDLFFPIQRVLLRLRVTSWGDARLALDLPARGSGSEVLLAAGGPYKHDVVCIRYLGEHGIAFRFHHRGAEPIESAPLRLSREVTHTLDVAMGSLYPTNARVLSKAFPEVDAREQARRLRVRLDGSEVLAGTFDFLPASPSLIAIGSDAINNGQCVDAFSGHILNVERSRSMRSR